MTPKKPGGAYCRSDDDCQSGECSYFKCKTMARTVSPTAAPITTSPTAAAITPSPTVAKKPGSAYCMSDDDCQSGECSYFKCKTMARTVSPTAAPITTSPTAAAITPSPTVAPITQSPASASPVTAETPTPPTEAPKVRKQNFNLGIMYHTYDHYR